MSSCPGGEKVGAAESLEQPPPPPHKQHHSWNEPRLGEWSTSEGIACSPIVPRATSRRPLSLTAVLIPSGRSSLCPSADHSHRTLSGGEF